MAELPEPEGVGFGMFVTAPSLKHTLQRSQQQSLQETLKYFMI